MSDVEQPDPPVTDDPLEDGPVEEVVAEPAADIAETLNAEEVPRLAAEQLRAIVEALIFASPEPLTPKMLLRLLSDEPKEDVLAAVEAVQQDYVSRAGLDRKSVV